VDLRGYRADPWRWGWGQIFLCGDKNGDKISPADTSGRGTGKLPLHIPRPIDIPNSNPKLGEHLCTILIHLEKYIFALESIEGHHIFFTFFR
jgi:hypothetical protein